ncbi:carbohydrate kinase family protein [Candidatus Gracilibacteria bacterium]|nr:carbohydrate kinase family protein [Candidatus Gracilibacteria bacterium]MCF7819401.1 carbohydrate kinase family protein [Candidatus Gracilibacteria bacterium]
MPKTFDVLCFGSVTLDIFLSPNTDDVSIETKEGSDYFCVPVGEKMQASHVFQSCGGSAANTSIGFAKLGLQSAAFGFLGDDEAREFIVSALKKEKVRTDFLQQSSHTFSSFSVIINAPDGRRSVFHYRNCQEDFDPQHLLKAPSAKAVYIGHLYGKSEDLLEALPQWKEKNPKSVVVWNPGKTQLKKGIAAFTSVIPQIDMLILNCQEAEQFSQLKAQKVPIKKASPTITGKEIPLNDPYPAQDIFDVRLIAQKFLDSGIKRIVITDGKQGAQYFTADQHFCVASPNVRTKSTLGAGDAFSVGVLAAFLKKKSVSDQLLWGTRNASSVIQYFGAQKGQLSLQKIEE